MITFKAKDKSGEIINSALTPFFFPAGEAHTKQEEQRDLELIEIAIIQPDADSIHDDLFQLAMWNDYIKRENLDLTSDPDSQSKRVLILPYMPGARADRGMPFGLSVYADFIRSMELEQIIIFDPHSGMTGDQLHAASDKQTYLKPHDLFDQVHMRAILNGYTAIIAPDKGAVDRASAVADLANLPVITATKTRDEATGRLSNFYIDIEDKEGTYLIVDDICDGGGTFLGLAAASGLDYGQLDLYVSHGVFSKEALTNLSKVFDYVYTTNSYNPTRPLTDGDQNRTFKRFDVIRPMLEAIDL